MDFASVAFGSAAVCVLLVLLRCCRRTRHSPSKKDDVFRDVEAAERDAADEDWVDFDALDSRAAGPGHVGVQEPEAPVEEEEPDPFALLGIVPTIQQQRVHMIDESPWQAAAPTSASLSMCLESSAEAGDAWGRDDLDLGGKRRLTAEERRRARQQEEPHGRGGERKKPPTRLAVTHQAL